MAHEIPTTRRAFAAQAAGFVALSSFGAVPVVASDADATLLALSKQFEAAWAVERAETADLGVSDDDFDEIVGRVSAIVSEIEKHTAHTLGGLVVKARACCWTHSGEPFDDESFENATTDMRLVSAILRDLLAIAGPAPWST